MYSKESKPTIGTLFKANRLIAKTVNRIIVEPDNVSLTDWATEAKLFISKDGNCLSSTTLLVYQKYVPTYSCGGRRYGVLINAEEAYVYDVNTKDANTNRIDKLKKRDERKEIKLQSKSAETTRLNLKTLDELGKEIQETENGFEMNEVLLDAPKDSLVGLFVRAIEFSPKADLKDYYLSLLEMMLIQKYLNEAFDLPLLKICLYYEREGKLGNFPSQDELFTQARAHGINNRNYPALFERLSSNYVFPKYNPITLKDFLARYEPQEVLDKVREQVIKSLIANYKPFVPREIDATTILNELVDLAVGINPGLIDETINLCVFATLKDPSSQKTNVLEQREYLFFSTTGESLSPNTTAEDDIITPFYEFKK
ncbi:hypothetical protein [Fluoribacter gormanii]|uniref:Uncharacterized protein n=1 Tax=Fluoribacter gormanii TaxID=464 RepID=A0A377GK93_9GAMM|nr:hypothetical protein [Fluoribacter gormanii]KTD00373.1 hypothetical protein Lgor_3268 [Fluoribacter gormanii]SIQ93215.1 hypothetical protein SAMN05421777_104149 [Fluoribacter gormanii]STO24752.1 Uncharacterised protein [Fluoribacter gormanii]